MSISTVSRVMNQRTGVDHNKRQRVLNAIKRLGYRPSESARHLSTGRITRVGFSQGFGSFLRPYNSLLRDCLDEELLQRGLSVETIGTDSAGLPTRVADAMVIGSVFDDDPRVGYLEKLGIPFVVRGKYNGAFCASTDEHMGARLAAEHLLRLGHQQILFVTGGVYRRGRPPDSRYTQSSHERFEGFRDALAAAGLTLPSSHVVDGEYTSLGGFLAVRKALADKVGFTAVFALSDEMALGTIAAIEDAGLRVPKDISVVGYDDLPGVGDTLTTVRQDVAALAHAIAELLAEAIDGKQPRTHLVPVQLVSRGTTARRLSGIDVPAE